MLALARAFAHFRTLTKLTVQAQYRNLLIQAEVAELRNRVSSAKKHPKVHPHKMKTPKHTLVHPKNTPKATKTPKHLYCSQNPTPKLCLWLTLVKF